MYNPFFDSKKKLSLLELIDKLLKEVDKLASSETIPATDIKLGNVKVAGVLDKYPQPHQRGDVYVSDSNLVSELNKHKLFVKPATTTTLGVVKVGDTLTSLPAVYCDVCAVNGKYENMWEGRLFIKVANKSIYGAVKIGDNINQSSGTISVPMASGSTLGVVKVLNSSGLTVNNKGEISLNTIIYSFNKNEFTESVPAISIFETGWLDALYKDVSNIIADNILFGIPCLEIEEGRTLTCISKVDADGDKKCIIFKDPKDSQVYVLYQIPK